MNFHHLPLHIAVCLVTLLASSQVWAGYHSTLSVGSNPVAPVHMRYSVAQAEADDAFETDDEFATDDASEEPEAGSGTCDIDTDCERGFVCLDGTCTSTESMTPQQARSKYDLDAGEWALYGGLVGHALWAGGLAMGALVNPPSHGSAFGVWGLYSASTIIATIGANSAIDNVGVFGGPGQKLGSWVFFGVGTISLGALQLLIALQEFAPGEDPVIDRGMAILLTSPSLLSAALMSSVAMRAHRQVRRAKRNAAGDTDEEAWQKLDQPKVKVGFNMNPYIADPAQPRMDGMIGSLNLRF